jgi:aspartate/methionine/tyrosine aminotransferase
MTDFSDYSPMDDWGFALALVEHCGVACVPGSSFFRDPSDGASFVRLVFS